jgi:putative ABC transport system permease protein
LTGGGGYSATVIEEFPPAQGEFPPGFNVHRTTPGYFEAMGIPVFEGRSFTSDDHDRRLGSVIISSSIKERYWPDASALGKRMRIAVVQAQVVGVVGDVHDTGLDVAADQVLYLPMLDAPGSNAAYMPLTAMTITVRTAGEPLSVVPAIRRAIEELDGDLPMANVRSMDSVRGDSLSRTSFTMSVLLIAALIALFLGSVGIYGVLSYVVSTRTTEIGIRSALGATPEAVRSLILGQGLRLTAIGVLIGLIAAVALGRVMSAQLYGISPVDPVTLIAGAAIFLAVTVLASLLPAARAAGTAPVDALRAS